MQKILFHYSPSLNITLENFRMSIRHFFKPGGFWLSDDSRDCGWAEWCDYEQFRPGSCKFVYDVTVDMQNILVLDSKKKVFEFAEFFLIPDENKIFGLNHALLEQNFSGILFSPFEREWSWQLPFGKDVWYSGIDCDSACIWDRNAIRNITAPLLSKWQENKEETGMKNF